MARLKVKEAVDLTVPLVVRDGFTVDVRVKTRRALERLYERCSRPKPSPVSGRMEQVLDDGLWAQNAPDAYIASWQGLKPSHFQLLGIALEEAPTTNGDGCIPYDAELARDIWREAFFDKFAQPIMTTAREALGQIEEDKKKDSPASGS